MAYENNKDGTFTCLSCGDLFGAHDINEMREHSQICEHSNSEKGNTNTLEK